MSEQDQRAGVPGGPTRAGAPGKRRGQAKKRHTVGFVVLAATVVLALVTGLSVVLVYRQMNANLTVVDPFEKPMDRPEDYDTGPKKPIRILVMASDTREGEGNDIDGEAGAAGSDTTILLHVSADRSRAYGISIPRDSLVTRPDCGDSDEIPGGENQMWNAAFALGQESCTVEQFELNTGVRIDDMVVIDFNGFKGMVDAIGGVPMCVPYDIDDSEHNIFIKAGEREMKGAEALDYVRLRDIGDGSDISRITRQQTFIAALVNKVVSAGTLARPDRIVRFLDAVTKSLTLSPGLEDVTKLTGLGLSLQNVGLDQIQFLTVPFEYPQEPEFRGRVRWTDDAHDLWRKIARDRPLSEELTDDSIKADRVPGSRSKPKPSTSPDSAETETETETEAEDDEPTAEEIERAHSLGLCA